MPLLFRCLASIVFKYSSPFLYLTFFVEKNTKANLPVSTQTSDPKHASLHPSRCCSSPFSRLWWTRRSLWRYVCCIAHLRCRLCLLGDSLLTVYSQLKNDIELKGTLKSVDQFLNLKLDNISCSNESKYPHLSSVRNIFIRGSTVRYVYLNKNMVDTNLLQDAARREAMSARK